MRKFFCNYNSLSEKYELSLSKNMLFNPHVNVLAENTLLPEIKQCLQNIYDLTNLLKEKITNEEQLKILDNCELLTSNLFYSLFASPLNLTENNNQTQLQIKDYIVKCVEYASKIESIVNIPEYNRICVQLKNHYQNLLNQL